MSARWFTFLVWAAVAASAVAWSLKLFVSPPAAAANAPVAGAGAAIAGDISRVLGAEKSTAPAATPTEAAAAPTDARFQLVGVVAPRGAGSGRNAVALIAVEGKTPRAYRTGALVDGEWVLQNVRARSVDLGPKGQGAKASVTLELPPLAAPATGSPSTFAGANAGAAPNPGLPGAPGMPGMPGAAVAPAPPAMPSMPGPRSTLPNRFQAPMPSMPGAAPNPNAAPTRNGLPKGSPGDGGTGHPPMQVPGQAPGPALK
jgi:general secretion pathway protein C